MIRRCTDADLSTIGVIINDAAKAYRGIIADDCWHEPYMSDDQLRAEIIDGVEFWCWDDSGVVIGVMGIQKVKDVTLIRHAYVLSEHQGRGIGRALLQRLIRQSNGPLLVGTWADAQWAIRFYERYGFVRVSVDEKDRLLRTYWKISPRQQETSVVLQHERREQ